jgi:GNAT superfamily N-acetyltransferase
MQRRGIGRALMQQIERHFPPAERFELFTGHRSPVNLLFYARLGYAGFREQKASAPLTLAFLEKRRPRQGGSNNHLKPNRM